MTRSPEFDDLNIEDDGYVPISEEEMAEWEATLEAATEEFLMSADADFEADRAASAYEHKFLGL